MVDCDDILRELRFGEDAAENDRRALGAGFVITPAHHSVVGDEADVVLGRKGTGKSAILWALESDVDQLRPPRTDIVAINSIGIDHSFRQLVQTVTEDSVDVQRQAWGTYFVAVAAARLNDILGQNAELLTAGDKRKMSDLVNHLGEAGINVRRGDRRGFREELPVRLATAIRAMTAQVVLDVANGQVGVAVGASDRRSEESVGPVEFDRVQLRWCLDEIEALLERVDRRLWIVLDNLDEVFDGTDRETEELAIRSIFRAHLDIAIGRDRFRQKILVREDIFDLMSAHHGFPGATRMRRHKIRWNKALMTAVLNERLRSCDAFCAAYRPDFNRAYSASPRALMPEFIGGKDALDWLFERTKDQGAMNPRNMLTLLSIAKTWQLSYADRRSAPREPLLSERALVSALRDLAEARFDDTIRVEYEHLVPYVRRFADMGMKFVSDDDVVRKLRVDTEHRDDVLADLEASGLMVRYEPGSWAVAPLYVPIAGTRGA